MQRICIIGSPGSGKSTLAKQLGEILNIEAIHMDTLFWKPNWTASSMDELAVAQAVQIEKDRWVIDGNYSHVWHDRLERADTIIFLDIPRRICFYRVLKRFWQNRNHIRSDIGRGCPEKIDFHFLQFVWTYPKKRKWKAIKVTESYIGKKQVIILRSRAEITEFIQNTTKELII